MFGPEQIEFLKEKQYLQGEETLEERINSIVAVVKSYEDKYSEGLSLRIKDYIERQILSLSTPQFANLGRGTGELPCSCNIVGVKNSIAGIYYAHGEEAILSKLGAGVGVDYTQVYDKGTYIEEGFYTNPKTDWIEDSIRTGQKVSQGSKRRGYVVPFISIEDKELDDILGRIDRGNSDKTDPFVSNNVGVVLPIGFRDKIKNGDPEARRRILEVLNHRKKEGKVYLVDVENMNKNQSPVYQRNGDIVSQTNICTEAVTPFYEDKTFACILSSLNLMHWDEIRNNPQIIKDSIMFLDITVEEYIRLTENVPFLEKARRSAIEKRDIGLGTLGFHDYIQSKGLAFGDVGCRALNKQIYSTIRKYVDETTEELAINLGSPKMCAEAGLVRRNVSTMMIAPNKTTSFIAQTTEGIEARRSNYTILALAGIQSVQKVKYLQDVLVSIGKDTNETWDSIMINRGSVQHLDFLTDRQKDIFKTADEISPKDIIDLAADRQVYIDMAQSINLFNRPNYTLKDIYDIHMYAFDKGIKTLYYFYPQAHAVLEKEGEKWDTCVSCAD